LATALVMDGPVELTEEQIINHRATDLSFLKVGLAADSHGGPAVNGEATRPGNAARRYRKTPT